MHVSRFFQNFNRYIIAIALYHFTISEIIEVVRMRNNLEGLMECLFLSLTYITTCLKYLNFSTRQSELRDLLNCFCIKLSQPKNSAEKLILKRYDRKGIYIYIYMLYYKILSICGRNNLWKTKVSP